MQYRASAIDKMKIEPKIISFLTSFKMADQNDDFITKESCKSFSIFHKFQMDNKWSECRELVRKFRKCKSQTQVVQRKSLCSFVIRVVMDNRTTVNMDPCWGMSCTCV